MGTLCRRFLKSKGCRSRHRLGRPQRYPHRKISPLCLQNLKQSSRIQSHPSCLIPHTRSWRQNAHKQDWFQTHCRQSERRIPNQRPYSLAILSLVCNVIKSAFDRVCVQLIPRSENVRADILSKLATLSWKVGTYPSYNRHYPHHLYQTFASTWTMLKIGQLCTSNTSKLVTPHAMLRRASL